jgi:hypothetical protein
MKRVRVAVSRGGSRSLSLPFRYWLPVALVVVLIVSNLGVRLDDPSSPTVRAVVPVATGAAGIPPSIGLAALTGAPRLNIPDSSADRALPGAVDAGASPQGSLHIFVSLAFRNLSELLPSQKGGGTGPASSPPILTASQFADRFALSPAEYATVVDYLRSFPGATVTSYPGRSAISIDTSAAVASAIFGTKIATYSGSYGTYYAPERPPTLPSPIAPWIAGVVGLGSGPSERAVPSVALESAPTVVAARGSHPLSAGTSFVEAGGPLPPAPVTISGVQEVYPTDLQIAYDEESLFSMYGVPSQANVAAILWSGSYLGASTVTPCGTLTTGENVGPFDPADFAEFFNETSPTGQPHPTLRSVPLSGHAPSCASSWDSNGTVLANTAELEAIGATAPGATVWGVSVASPTLANLDTALVTILSPPGNLTALRNVSVVEAGWQFPDQNDSTWSNLLIQAGRQGVTVVAPTGDAADSASSAAWSGSQVSFPSTDATNTTGSVAVGGTTLELNPTTLHMTHEVTWNEPSTVPSAVRGSSGGISAVFPEPSWQSSSLAASVLTGRGRGVPDVAAIANNTLVTVTIDGATWDALNATTYGSNFVSVNGTGVAAAVETGILATVDRALVGAGASPLGFANPLLYVVASEEFTPLPNGAIIGHYQGTSSYNSSLPTLPFHDVLFGRNTVYAAAPGYDLVTGWGSIDAYNYTMYLMPAPTAPTWGRLQGVEDSVNLTGLAVVSAYPGGSPAPSQSASIQQNLFLANVMGAPVYWVQSVTTLRSFLNGTKVDWSVDYQAWLILPFWGLYPSLAVYEFDVPGGTTTTLPLSLTIETILLPGGAVNPPQLQFAFGGPASPTLSFPAPGAAYIIGAANHTYNWQGVNYTNGPNGSGAGGHPGFLAPQIALVGFPGGAKGNFETGTAGSLSAYIEPSSGSGFLRAGTGIVTTASTQTGESASNLTFTATSTNGYTLAYAAGAGTAEQGIYQYEVPRFQVRFSETGAPARSTWYVNITGTVSTRGSALGSVTTLSFSLPNGSYTWTGAINVKGWSSIPRGGPFTVAGAALAFTLQFGQSTSNVTFVVLGPPTGSPPPFTWTVNISGGPVVSGATSRLQATVFYGSYSFRVTETNRSWKPANPNSSFVASAASTLVYVRILPVTYVCELVFRLPGGVSPLMSVRLGSHAPPPGYFSTFGARFQNGTVLWSVGIVSGGDTASPTHGSITVHGPGPAASKGKYVVVVTITAPPPFGLFGIGIWGYVLVAGAAGSAALLVVLILLRRRALRRSSEQDGSEEEAPPEAEPSIFDENP